MAININNNQAQAIKMNLFKWQRNANYCTYRIDCLHALLARLFRLNNNKRANTEHRYA